jgi:glucosamine-6-phosphate deaminase
MDVHARDKTVVKSLPDVGLPTFVVEAREEAEREVAREVVGLVRERPDAVLGLPTGNTPVGVYHELIAAHRSGDVSFARAQAFNLDEYLGLESMHPGSFERWMEAHFFAHVDFDRARRHVPSVTVAKDADRVAREYESSIRTAGGIDLLLLGIGRNGHIGFNEPGSPRDSRTRVVDLHPITRADAAVTFGGLEHVPKSAVTMGIGTMLDARRIRVLAFGERKAAIVRETLFAPQSSACPATFLHGHRDVKLFVDAGAAMELRDR